MATSVFAIGTAFAATTSQGNQDTIVLPPVTVQGTAPAAGEAPEQASYQAPPVDLGSLGRKAAQDTPQSTSDLPGTLLTNQQVHTVNDALNYLPSVEIRDQQGMEVSRPQSRGFQSSIAQNTRLDGLNVVGTTAIPADNLDGIQVLNGLAGALYGPQSPSGVFNYQTKKPTDETFFDYTQGFESNSLFTEQLDAGGRVGPNDELGYRVNLVHGGGEGYVDHSDVDRTLGSLYLDYRLDDRTTVSAYYSHYETDITGLPGEIVYFSNGNTILPKPSDPTRQGLGQPGAGSDLTTDTAMVKVQHRFNGDWTLDVGGLYENADRGLYGITNTLTGNDGAYKVVKNFNAIPRFDIYSNSAYLNGHIDAFGLRNDVSFGTNGFWLGQFSSVNSLQTSLGSGNLADPQVLPLKPVPNSGGQYRSGSLFEQSIIVGDTLHLDAQWALQAELSSTFLQSDSYNANGRKTSTNGTDGAVSPTVSVLYKPIDRLTLYATYANSIEQGDQAPTTAANANVFMSPYRDEMYEVGAKYAVNPNLLVTLDGFRMTRPLAETNAASNVFSVVGNQRNWGAELFAQGAVTPDLSLLGGVTYIDARLVGTGNAATDDLLVIGVPHWKTDVAADYHPAMWDGVALTAAVHAESARAATNTNNTYADAFATLDLGARYSTAIMGHKVTARFQVDNVTNTSYYVSIADGSNIVGANGGDTAWYGAPRTFLASLEMAF